MGRINTRNQLNNVVNLYLHRTIDNETMDWFTTQATERLGIDLRSKANQGTVVLTAEADPRSNIYLLPADFVEPRFVEQVNGAYLQQIRPQGVSVQNQFETLGNTAFSYLIYSDTETQPDQSLQMVLQLLPGNGQDINLTYWQVPQYLGKDKSESGQLTNPTLLAYPTLYLYATLIEAWAYVQDFAQSDKYYQLYNAELDRINKADNVARYGVGAAASAPARFYNNAPSRAM